MPKKNIYLLLVLFVIIILSVLPYKHQTLILISKDTTGPATDEFKVNTPSYLYAIEPLTGLSDYFQSLKDPKKQILSWVLWLAIGFGITQKSKNFFKGLLRIFVILILFTICVILLILFIPSKYQITNTNPAAALIDFHSHTNFSHDGFTGIGRSNDWHLKRGFNFFYVTDHSVNRYMDFVTTNYPAGKKLTALPGEEVADKNGGHFLVLGLGRPLPEHLINGELTKIVSYVHSNGGAVAVAHWWHKEYSPIEQLLKSGIDAIEVYGHEVTPLRAQKQKDIIESCRENSIPMIAGTNWHGWGTKNDMWSIFYFNGWQKLTIKEFNKKIIEYLKHKKTDAFKVLFLQKNEPQTALRVIFEPFVGLFYYLLGLNFLQCASWCIWLLIGNVISRRIISCL